MQLVRIGYLLLLAIIVSFSFPATVFAQAGDQPEIVDSVASTEQETELVSEPPSQPAVLPPPISPDPPAQVVTESNDNRTAPDIPMQLQSMAVQPPTQSISKTSSVIITEVRLGGDAVGPGSLKEYVTLANVTSAPISLANWQLQYAKTTLAKEDCSKDKWTTNKVVSGTIQGGSSATIEIALNDATAGSVRIIDAEQFVHDLVGWGSAAPCFESSTGVSALAVPANNKSIIRYTNCDGTFEGADTNDNARDFVVAASLAVLKAPECTIIVLPESPNVNSCEGMYISEIGANRDDQFIEIYNATSAVIDATGCQIQTNRSSTKSYVFGSESIGPYEYKTIYVKDTTLTLTKTTTGTVYILSSDGKIEVDAQTYSNLSADTSWAKFEDGWRQTYAATPSAHNIDQTYVACDEGYVRNESTGRCNKIAAETQPADCGEGKYRSEETGRCRTIPAASVLTACKLGQYRSEETNRCRNLVTASALKPCKDGQYRSEETNRCRNIATASTNLKPCKENQYRSEETNRCRNLPTKAVPAAAYAVEPVKDGAKAFVGWWALGGITVMALGYAAWEWRAEVRSWLRWVWTFGKK